MKMKKLLIATGVALSLTITMQSFAYEKNPAKDKTTVGQKIDDATITTSVNGKLVGDKELSALEINVDSSKGKVILKGDAPNLEAKKRAEMLAKNTEGVISVDNRLKVSSDRNSTLDKTMDTTDKMKESTKSTYNKVVNKIDDGAINASLNTRLAADAELSALKINVDVNNGNVLLKGTAPSLSAKNRATEIAQKVDGVTSVKNQLVLKK